MFETVVQRGVGFMLIALIVYLLLRLIVFRPKKGSVNGVDRKSFELKIFAMNEHCSEYSLKEFMRFLDKYKGGRIIKERGRIVVWEFTAKEKGELKSLFYDVVAPAKDVSIATKEQYRNYIRNLKVDGVDMRPRYEDYTKRITDKDVEDDKVVSYFADYNEDEVLTSLKKGLDASEYVILDDVSMKVGELEKDFGHIVIGDNGAFLLLPEYASNISELKDYIDEIGKDFFLDAQPLIVVKNYSEDGNTEGSYKKIDLRNLCSYIRTFDGRLPINEKMMLVSRIRELSAY